MTLSDVSRAAKSASFKALDLYTDWRRREPGVTRGRCILQPPSFGRHARRAVMRRGTMLVVGLLLASVAMPPPAAEARPLLFKILRGMTAPFGPMMGAKRYSSRRAHHSRRAVASRTRPAAVAAAPAAAAAATGVAAASTSGNAPRDAGTATTGSAPVQDPSATASAPEARQDEAAVPLPVPAPAQRNAALTAPESEPQARASAPDQAAPAAQPAPVPRAPFRLGTVGPAGLADRLRGCHRLYAVAEGIR